MSEVLGAFEKAAIPPNVTASFAAAGIVLKVEKIGTSDINSCIRRSRLIWHRGDRPITILLLTRITMSEAKFGRFIRRMKEWSSNK
jgi:hypothetical protein